jgi:hypothetical protein
LSSAPGWGQRFLANLDDAAADRGGVLLATWVMSFAGSPHREAVRALVEGTRRPPAI